MSILLRRKRAPEVAVGDASRPFASSGGTSPTPSFILEPTSRRSSELAAKHERFWEAHPLLLSGRVRFSREDLLYAARRLELDPGEADEALARHSFRERVLADVDGGRQAGVHGTPTFFVDGETAQGPWRQLAQIVPARLGAAKHSAD